MYTESVKTFFAGKSVFLTGATGFIGKVLIEKLLRSCPEIDKIYILIRTKKGKSLQERVQDITSVELFDTLKEKYPDAIATKLKPLLGDASQLCLGLSEADRKELKENVSIIYHAAASVRFDDPLKNAILLNTRGTREVIRLALEMKKLEVFVHVSTTYCNTDKKEVEERLYPPHADWKKSIDIAENVSDEYDLEVLTSKYIDVLPNTYTFTKSLAEHVVVDMCKNKIPAVVFRPSIVIASKNDPVPGWIDNFNGPVGLLVASGKGILRTCYTDPNLKADYMPVDITVKALLMATWQKGIAPVEEKLDVDFYNCSNNNMHTVTMKQLIDLGRQIFWEVPLNNILWCPGGGVTACKYWNYIRVILLHLIPAIIIDSLLRLMDKKPILVKIQRRIYIANMALQYFITNQWAFLNDKCISLEKKLLPTEMEEFGYDIDDVDVYEYFKNCVLHSRRYLLKETDMNIEKAKLNLHRMYILDKVVKILVFIFVYWLLIYKLNILTIIASKIFDYIAGYM